MAKSNYGQIKKYENEILAMKEADYTKRRIAEELALTKEQIKEFLKRHRRRERKIEVGIPGRSQGRSSKGNTVNDVELAPKYENRGRPQNLIFHSDRGAQYTSAGYVNLLRSLGITQSFSRSGSPYDNAVIESLFNLLKKEELHRRVYRSEQEFLRCVDEYISFSNSSRPHRYNNYKSPDSIEKLFEKSMLSADLP